MPRLCPSGRVCETEKTAESEDLYMADMQEPGLMEEDWLHQKLIYRRTDYLEKGNGAIEEE